MFYTITDIILGLAILFCFSCAVWFARKISKNAFDGKRKKIAVLLLVFFLVNGAVLVWGSFFEPRMIVVREETVFLSHDSTTTVRSRDKNTAAQEAAGENRLITVALISDVHAGRFKGKRFIEKIARKIETIQPDIVLVAGDNILGPAASPPGDDYSPMLYAFKDLANAFPMYAVLGNHEYNVAEYEKRKYFYDQSDRVESALEGAGVQVLRNESKLIDVSGQRFWLLGVDEVLAGRDDLAKALEHTDTQHPKILLAHNPDIILRPLASDIPLILSGHTHGGQIRLPFIGALVNLPTALGNQYDKGWFDFGSTKLFITSGIGESASRMRLFNPPEIVVLKMHIR